MSPTSVAFEPGGYHLKEERRKVQFLEFQEESEAHSYCGQPFTDERPQELPTMAFQGTGGVFPSGRDRNLFYKWSPLGKGLERRQVVIPRMTVLFVRTCVLPGYLASRDSPNAWMDWSLRQKEKSLILIKSLLKTLIFGSSWIFALFSTLKNTALKYYSSSLLRRFGTP